MAKVCSGLAASASSVPAITEASPGASVPTMLLFLSSVITQCAAVTTTVGAINVPVQNCPFLSASATVP